MSAPHARFTGSVVALLALVGAMAAGCGKTDTTTTGAPASSLATTTTAAPPLTKEQYVAQANAICKVAKDESNKIGEELSAKYPDPKAVPEDQYQALSKDFVTRLLPFYKKVVTDLRALTPPAADAAVVAKGVDTLDKAVKAMEADPSIAGEPTALSYQEGYDYGLTECFTPATKKFVTVGSAIS